MRRGLVVGIVTIASLAHVARARAEPTPLPGLAIVPPVLGYLVATIVFATDDTLGTHGLAYGTTEAALDAPFTVALGALATISFAHHRPGTGAVFTGLALVNGVLTYDGMHTMIDAWPHPVRAWSAIAGAADALQLSVFAGRDLLTIGERGADRWGIVEAAINAPVAAGLAYLTVGQARDGHAGPAIVLGGGAALSALLAAHGVVIAARRSAPAAPTGLAITPTLVGDGRAAAIGLGVGGTF